MGVVTGGAGPLLELLDIEKSYAGVRALRGARLTIGRPGTVHALTGQNGCGKSSLLGILSGQLQPDRGEIRIEGRATRFSTASDAVRQGIAMVAQETAVAEDLTVAENVLMGRMMRGPGGIDWKASRARARQILGRLGLDYDPRWIVGQLRPDQKQMVEIARAISLDAKILILDEPTSSLTEDEVTGLFAVIRELAQHGVAILFVSHRLAEVFEISDEITVMRNGRTVGAGPVSTFTTESLVDAMVGGVDLHGGPVAATASPSGLDGARPLLEVRQLSSYGAVRGVDLQLRPGRLVGIAGLAGSAGASYWRRSSEFARSPTARSSSTGTHYGVRRRGSASRPASATFRPTGSCKGWCCPCRWRATSQWSPRTPKADCARLVPAASAAWPAAWPTGSRCAPLPCPWPSAHSAAATSRRSCSASGWSRVRASCSSTTPRAEST